MLAVASQNLIWAQRFLEMERLQNLSEEDRAAEAKVVDLDSTEVECPACQAAFNPADQPTCPGCGLRLAP